MTATLARRSWGWVMFDGIVGVVVGIAAIAWPGVTVLVLALLLGIGLLVQGGFAVAAGGRAGTGSVGRGWTVVFGVIALIAGVICLISPATGLYAIVLGVTVWFFVAGANELVSAFTLSEHRVWNFVAGVLSVICGLILIAIPGLALTTAAFLAGLLFLLRGIGEIGVAVNLRNA